MSTKSVRWWRNHCLSEAGDHEQPLGSNRTKYGEQFGWNGVSWCCEYGWDAYKAAGVVLPIKSASCVAIYDWAVKHGYRYDSDHCVPGDSVIRTWQHLTRHAPGFNPAETHYQEVLRIKTVGGRKWLGLWGGNQGAGYVGPHVEWVPAGDPSILGGLAWHRLFKAPKPVKPAPEPKHSKTADNTAKLPARKSHKHPSTAPKPSHAPRWFRFWWGRWLAWWTKQAKK